MNYQINIFLFNNKMKLPPELIDKIFKEGESNPRIVRSFGKIMSTKTKQKLTNCTKVIETGDLKKVRLLKFHNSKCTHNDLLYAIEKGYMDIAKYINSAYPEARLEYSDVLSSVFDGNAEYTNKLLEIYKFTDMEEYTHIFTAIPFNNKRMMKVILDRRPNKNKALLLSELFDNPVNFFMINIDEYLKNFMSVANNIIIDDVFISRLLIEHHYNNLDLILTKYHNKKMNREIKVEIINFAKETQDLGILAFMEKYPNIF